MGFLHGEPPQDSLLASGSPRESRPSLTPGLAARGRRRGGTASRGGEGLDVITRPAANLATGRRTDGLPRVSRRGTDYLRNTFTLNSASREMLRRGSPARQRASPGGHATLRRSRIGAGQIKLLQDPYDQPLSGSGMAPKRSTRCRVSGSPSSSTLRLLWSIEAKGLAACDPSDDGERGSNTRSTG